MDIDIKAGTITFRVLYHGPEGATKFLNLRGLQSSAAVCEDLCVLHADGDRVMTLAMGGDEIPPLLGLRVAFDAVAAPGATASRAIERMLVLAADAVVFLPDRRLPAGSESRRALARLSEGLSAAGNSAGDIPLVIQNYEDGSSPLERRHLDAHTAALEPVFVSVPGDTPEAAEVVFRQAREAVLHRVSDMGAVCGIAAAREALARRVSDREAALSAVAEPAEESWSTAALWAMLGAMAAAAVVSWLL